MALQNSASSPRQAIGQSRIPMAGEDFSDYVAHLQLHMSLQARNLVPHLNQAQDSRTVMLHETQALCEKQISRQG